MALAGKSRVLQAVAVATSLTMVLLVLPRPAAAGFFDRLFGGLQRAIEAPAPAVTDPFTSLIEHLGASSDTRVRADNAGPQKAFCVRRCDGHYFPVLAHAGLSAAEACHAFCPASATSLYIGSNIDYATTNDGSRYAALPNAFAYRKKIVPGCSCNGRTAFGLAHIDATTDPTLRPGDIVATESGLMAFTGKGTDRTNVAANFTPIDNYNGLSKAARERLNETRIAAPTTDVTGSIPRTTLNARAQAAR